LQLVGLGDRLHHLPRQLSGGQEQRVAIARAIVTDPIWFSPTSPLATSTQVPRRKFSACFPLKQEFGKTIVMVTHDPHAAHFALNRVTWRRLSCCRRPSTADGSSRLTHVHRQ